MSKHALGNIKSTTLSKADKALWGFTTLASIDNPKASKATKVGFLNAILYLAPADSANVHRPAGMKPFNVCVHAGACVEICLGRESGQAQIRKQGVADNQVTIARAKRSIMFMAARRLFMAYLAKDVRRLDGIARRHGLQLCYRPDGSSDTGMGLELARLFPAVCIIGYTKNPNKMQQYLNGDFPPNYHLTFSYDCGTDTVPSNARLAERFLLLGGNVAVVGNPDALASDVLRNAPRVDGDEHDVRIPELDGRGKVIVLTPKGRKAQTDDSGFVVRMAA